MGSMISKAIQIIRNFLVEKSYMNVPRSTGEWCQISVEFTEQWNFPHLVGAIDWKHVSIQAPARSGSTYFSYKVLLA